MQTNGILTSHINDWDMGRPPSITTKDEKTPYKRNRPEAFNSPTNEVQNEVSNQNYKSDKLCSLIEKLFRLMVENNLCRLKNVNEDEGKNDMQSKQ